MAKDWKGFERKVAELLTNVYYPEDDGEFRRVPQSGGWDKKVVTGDIMALKRVYGGGLVFDLSFPFSVECKTYRDIKHFFSGLYSAESELFEWMNQSQIDCEHIRGRMSIVTFKLYRQKIIAMLKAQTFTQLKELFGEPSFKYYFLRRHYLDPDDRHLPNLLVLCLFSDFVEWIDWEVYKLKDTSKYIKSWRKK